MSANKILRDYVIALVFEKHPIFSIIYSISILGAIGGFGYIAYLIFTNDPMWINYLIGFAISVFILFRIIYRAVFRYYVDRLKM